MIQHIVVLAIVLAAVAVLGRMVMHKLERAASSKVVCCEDCTGCTATDYALQNDSDGREGSEKTACPHQACIENG